MREKKKSYRKKVPPPKLFIFSPDNRETSATCKRALAGKNYRDGIFSLQELVVFRSSLMMTSHSFTLKIFVAALQPDKWEKIKQKKKGENSRKANGTNAK